MEVKVIKIGNSLAIRLPKKVAQEIHVTEGNWGELTTEADQLIFKPKRNTYKLKDLLKGITQENLHGEIDFGTEVGAEQVE